MTPESERCKLFEPALVMPDLDAFKGNTTEPGSGRMNRLLNYKRKKRRKSDEASEVIERWFERQTNKVLQLTGSSVEEANRKKMRSLRRIRRFDKDRRASKLKILSKSTDFMGSPKEESYSEDIVARLRKAKPSRAIPIPIHQDLLCSEKIDWDKEDPLC